MTRFYDARGNIYGVVSPAYLREQGIAVPEHADLAASTRTAWSTSAITSECGWGTLPHALGAKAHRCDGLLVGPFQSAPPFDLLIVNTDGTLAERSGNGLTIFAQALTDEGLMTQGCELRVHHDKQDAGSPVTTTVEPAVVDQRAGFWLALGRPAFGPSAAGAEGVEGLDPAFSHVPALSAINPQWARSQFVRVGNPHCVTLVEHADALPDNRSMQQPELFAALQAIAFAPPAGRGQPCAAGVNLQWALRAEGNQVIARVFERGEGPTASSGTSASAVACAAWRAGWVESGNVAVVMPGGTAPVRLHSHGGMLLSVSLFGAATPQK
ncbi:diaminopimelate epimerase [Pseudomonas tolaasii]|uniref:Diaminopimelate epimerase n=2 Tax=Pseudomonas tolaasii TaxID=29442 RepID=A0A7Y8AVR6_PSETO|nr:diaminopimelate epimerase [Pseudomonas tolaasii]ARB30819.1 diaminopimelate epimerase [Pseudomonas tolaasii]KAB0467203.1 diaminopimelate epimerase [Pseudomonas tolaasii]MBW1249558.1 diaminopimelate epimerase [Pseudomonas tolaasii]MBW4796078.1 diaminopimelate epimerase [Pseudomonas tolaasii]MBY8943157.1 diaminopimelate epimerase [Pseudomonas tolaasii]